MADLSPARRGRPVPARRTQLAAPREVPARDHQGGRRRPAGGHQRPDADRRRCGRPALEEPGPVRGLRGDHPGDGRRGHGTGSRHGRVHPVEVGLARVVPGRQGRGDRDGPRGRGRPGDGGRLALHRDPVRADAGRRLGRDGRAGLARPVRLGGRHVPRQHRDRIGGRGGRARVPRAPRPVDRVGDPRRRALHAGWPGRTCRGRRDRGAGRCRRRRERRRSRRSS